MKRKYDADGEPTNELRTAWADAALYTYKNEIKKESGPSGVDDVQDLISDVLHLLERKIKVDCDEMARIFAWAFRRYSEETKKKAYSFWAFDIAEKIENDVGRGPEKFSGGLAIGIRDETNLYAWSKEIPPSGLTFSEVVKMLSDQAPPNRVLIVKDDHVIHDENVKSEDEE